ncbi:MAG: hypothetical protein WKG01_10940, partial [Kofleriaceae bacterium]
FAALALDVRKLYRTLGGESPGDPLKLEPSRGFGGNLQGLLRHFGAAVEHGAGFAAIEPAWRDLIRNLRRHAQSGQLAARRCSGSRGSSTTGSAARRSATSRSGCTSRSGPADPADAAGNGQNRVPTPT